MNKIEIFKKFFFKKYNLIYIAIISFLFFLDRITKIKIIDKQLLDEKKIFVNDYLNFDLIWNTGIGFGLLSQNANTLYHLITLVIFFVIIILFYITFKPTSLDSLSFTFVLGGAIGNFYDRVVYFAVPDFIDIHISDYHWFTFNVADIFISFGIISIILKDIVLKKK
jgi:signal peptidase II